jgi:hypothetical protein
MKKWIFWLPGLIILTFLSIYIFIPSKILISKFIVSGLPIAAEFRYISKQDNWEKWWRDAGGKSHHPGEPFTYNGSVFRLRQLGYNVVGIEIEQDGIVLQSEMDLVSLSRDSTWTRWNCQWPTGNNPIRRLIEYKRAVELSKNMKAVLVNLRQFFLNPKNVYDVDIFRTSFRDTSMLSTRFISSSYPSTEEIYRHFDALRKSIQKQKAQIKGYPMMSVSMLKSDSFETQLAIPTDRSLQNEGTIFYRKMVPGNFLCSVVKGGRYSIDESMRQMEFFLREHGKIQMAIPFEQLVTDRLSEPDTTKWITRIYLPVAE